MVTIFVTNIDNDVSEDVYEEIVILLSRFIFCFTV